MSYGPSEETVAYFEGQLNDWKEKLKKWEDDYAILIDQEKIVAQLFVVCDNNEYLTNVLDYSIDEMKMMADEVDVPSFDSFFDFSELKSNGALFSKFLGDNTEAQNELQKVGIRIDECKDELSANICEASNEISRISAILDGLKS